MEKIENTDKVGNGKYKHSHHSVIILLVYISMFIFSFLPHFHPCKLITFIACFSAMLITVGSDLVGSDLFPNLISVSVSMLRERRLGLTGLCKFPRVWARRLSLNQRPRGENPWVEPPAPPFWQAAWPLWAAVSSPVKRGPVSAYLERKAGARAQHLCMHSDCFLSSPISTVLSCINATHIYCLRTTCQTLF